MLIGSGMQNFSKVAQLEIPKNHGELCMSLIFLSPQTENTEFISKIEKPKI